MYPYLNIDKKIDDVIFYDWLVLGRAPKSIEMGNRNADYVLMQDYHVEVVFDDKSLCIVVPKGMTTDLASVPKLFRSIVGRTGPHLEAAIIHDWLYVAWQLQDRKPTKADHKFADDVLLAGMKAAGCSRYSRLAVWFAMKFSWGVYKGRDKNIFVEVPK